MEMHDPIVRHELTAAHPRVYRYIRERDLPFGIMVRSLTKPFLTKTVLKYEQ